jgi:uncharacterized membrane protein YkvA (DUF1232 family)
MRQSRYLPTGWLSLITVKGILREVRILRFVLLGPSCLLSKLTLLLGMSYLFVPLDLIPDRIPIIGHLDELSFVLFGFVGSRRLVPDSLVEYAYHVDSEPSAGEWKSAQFALRILRADLANFFLLHYRRVDGFLITGKNSGTHWLKFMLSCALAEQFGVPRPRWASGRDAGNIISHPKWPHHADLPWIGSSHTIPSVVFSWAWFCHFLPHPPVVVLVRDIDAAMRSNYMKWRQRYDTTPSRYVRGDPNGRRYIADVWWYIHFFNRWGDAARAQPNNILVVRYEDLKASPDCCIRRIAGHYGIQLSNEAIAAALCYVDRDAIRLLLDPTDKEFVIPPVDASASVFAPADEAYIWSAMRRHLRYDFGYGYNSRNRLLGYAADGTQQCD